MLGHVLFQTLSDQFSVWTTTRRPLADAERLGGFDPFRTIGAFEADDPECLHDAIESCLPDTVVNCVGLVKQSPIAESPELAIAINALLPHRLAAICSNLGIRLIHISTDCVFSGTSGPYTEDSPIDAMDLYGKTKALGEVTYEGHLTLRTSIVGPELFNGYGLLDWFLKGHHKVNGHKNALFTGLTTFELSRVIADLIANRPEISGLYHVASQPVSKYDLLCQFKDAFGLGTEIVPVDKPEIDRRLDAQKFSMATGYTAPSWAAMTQELAQMIQLSERKTQHELSR